MKQSHDKGSIYITVIIILAVILMLLSMLIIITSRDVRTSNLYSEGVRASYLAHSGIARGIADAKIIEAAHKDDNPRQDIVQVDSENDPFASQYGADHRIDWQVNYDRDDNDYTIVSTGLYEYNDKITVKRTLEVNVRVQGDHVQVVSWKQKT